MNLRDLVRRSPLVAGESTEKIPWHEPGFSARMLREHLSQDHDAASRRAERIDRQVGWLQDRVMEGEASRVLDLGCGPGLYTSRLARRGHTCVGIDFSPASIRYAREEAKEAGLACQYHERDLTQGGFGTDFDVVLVLFGELNTFEPAEVGRILASAHAALAAGGKLVLEVSPYAAVEAVGRRAPSWYTRAAGLFCDDPHLVLQEAAWDAERGAASERFNVVEASTGRVSSYSQTLWAHRDDDYARMLGDAGFDEPECFGSLEGDLASPGADLVVLVARRG